MPAAQARSIHVNDSQPIFSRIPIEILSMIASLIPPDFRGRGAPGIALSHACTRWRQIALSCRDLWTEIPLQHPEWTQLCLDRSRPTLISIAVNGEYIERGSPYFQATTLALSEMLRVRNLDISTYGDEDARLILPLISESPAPHLEELYLTFYDVDDHVDIPLNIFSGDAPSKLRILSLFACNIPFDSPLLLSGTLTTIELSSCDIWDTVDEMVETLSHFHNVESFLLDSCTILEDMTPSSMHTPRSVKWPQLRYFTVGSTFPETMTLFHYLDLPPNIATLSLYGEPSDNGMPEGIGDIIISSLAQHFAPLSNAGLSCDLLRLRLFRDHFSVDGNWSREDAAKGDTSPYGHKTTSFIIPRWAWSWGSEGTRKSREVLMGIFDLLPFITRTKALYLSSDVNFLKSPEEWRMLSHFSLAETVEISGCTAFTLVSWLHASSHNLHFLFPSLHILRLDDVDLQQAADTDVPSVFNCMLTALGSSPSSKCVERVEIRRSDVSEANIAILQGLLGEDGVLWDGKTEGAGGSLRVMRKHRIAKREAASRGIAT
ncbi:hypothetical protein OF83DRAFT_92203 [Amylostereum chailletii]|nr:hypothetical protein OF83DRAFT_92203 [Amylostereum chailletii]